MNWAIFWLPLIAGILLGGLAVGNWYGGDKTLAVWVGFVGAVLFLLTAALKGQQYVWRVADQPKLSILPSGQRSYLRWDPPASYQMQINDVPNPDYGAWKVPALLKILVRNSGAVAQDATIKWGVTPYEMQALIESSPRLKDNIILAESNRITLGSKTTPSTPWMHSLEWSVSVPLPFITRETTAFIPAAVWDHAALFFIATLSDEPHARSAPFVFDAQINWNIPEGGQPKRFRVKVIAENAKLPNVPTPKFLANIEIEVAELE
jgi:hypothetical protein